MAIITAADQNTVVTAFVQQHLFITIWNTKSKVLQYDPSHAPLVKLLEAHKDVFDEGLGTLRGTKAKIYVESDAEPKFFKARPVLYGLKSKVEDELERLQKEGILSPVELGEWAAPIVPLLKPNNTIRICGDYK